ncbi:DNA polymerase III subunit beta [Agrobacterium sp.]|uniref:DNA polymerase III subunit beta n=1 Tax=Agrobacterium sp. TaxID=361 RepID=UPI0028AA7560|nr:DNA polymerase III subunit beta [Agrobacterium sp.]
MADVLFKVHRTELLTALEAATQAVDAKGTIPILSNILLKPEGGRLIVCGTDLDVEIRTSCDLIEAQSVSGVTVAAKELREITRAAPESAEIVFERGRADYQIGIRAARSRYSIHTLPDSDFPSIGRTLPDLCITMGSALFSEVLGKVYYAIEKTNKARMFLMGAYLHASGDRQLTVVGLDGRQMAVVRMDVDEQVEFPSVIVPVKTVAIFRKLFGPMKTPCKVYISDSKIAFESGDTTLISRLVDGTFPDYSRIMPRRLPQFVTADRDAMKAAIKRTCVVAADTSKDGLKVSISHDGLQLQLVSKSGETASEAVDADYAGENYEIGFNGSFLSSLLESISTTSFRMHGSDPAMAGLFTPDNDADEDYILMPMRV